MSELLIGVDIGTTNLKVGVFTVRGECRALAERPCPLEHREGGRIEVEPTAWWHAAEECLLECLAKVPAADIRAIGVSSQAQTYVFLDAAGHALGPAVSWLDATGDAEGLRHELGAAGFYEHTGWAEPSPLLAAAKFRRISASRPDAWSGIAHVLFPDGYLAHRLTGQCAVSRNLAAMSGLYSMPGRNWWPAALAASGVPPGILPSLRETGEAAGRLLPDLQKRWKLGAIPVVLGANDQTVAAIGAGLREPGQTVVSLGTAMVAYQVVRPEQPLPASRPLRGPYVSGWNYQMAISSATGAYVDWVKKLAGSESWEKFYAQALAVPPGAAGLRFRPIEGSRGHEGVMEGIALHHDLAHLSRAVLEGVACTARELLDQLGGSVDLMPKYDNSRLVGPLALQNLSSLDHRLEGERPREPIKSTDLGAGETVRLTGGGSSNDAWVQTLADITGRRLERLDQPQTGLLGTALAAGQGAGVLPDLLEAAANATREIQVFKPSGKHEDIYRQVYADFNRRER